MKSKGTFLNIMTGLFRKHFQNKKTKIKEVRDGESLYLKVPEILPNEILSDIAGLFAQHKSISKAYLAEGFLEIDEDPHYIIGIRIDPGKGVRQLMQEMALDISKIIPRDFYVDFIELNENKTQVNDFMSNYLIPFYSRK